MFRNTGTLTDVVIGSVTATGTTATISFDPDLTQVGSHSLDLYAVLNGVESLLFSNIAVSVEADCTVNSFVGSALSSTAITVVVGSPVTATFTVVDYVSSLFGNMDGTTYCGNLTPSSFVFRNAGTLTDIAIGTVTATGTTASISF